MEDIQVVLSSHNKRIMPDNSSDSERKIYSPTSSKIPDLFFDEILVEHKLTRPEILVMMYLYRITWCKPNINSMYGIAPIISHKTTAESMELELDTLLQSIKKLQTYGFIETIRSGQYFVRKFFTEDNDKKYGQTYDDFL